MPAPTSPAARSVSIGIAPVPVRTDDRQGCIDSYGFSEAADAWLLIGWMPRLGDPSPDDEVTLHFSRHAIRGRCFRTPFARGDLPAGCDGVVILAGCAGRNLGPLVCAELLVGEGVARLFATEQIEQLADQAIVQRARSLIAPVSRDTAAVAILKSLSRQAYGGRTTLHEIGCAIFIAVDEAIRCGSEGIVLIGWQVAEEGVLRRAHLRARGMETAIDFGTAIRTRRDDVSGPMARDHGIVTELAGFVMFVPGPFGEAEGLHLQIETADLSMGYVTLPPPRLKGVPAMRRILETFSLRYEDLVRSYDRTVGPAIAGLNAERLRVPVASTTFDFGSQPAAPPCSVIVPLYGRIDFMEYQLALFSREPANRRHEFLYVLDDPSLRAPLLSLAESCLARFGLPFRIVVLDRNVGYGPANNAGLRHARGTDVCFLNSDVFPGEDRWIDRLAARLADDPSLGAVGPVLLFEDGTVQHRGLAYERLQEFGDWLFPLHPGKGMRPPRRGGLETHPAITGACLMMTRALAHRCGGFDERFVIGDFEDSDLCLRIGALGLDCAVDLDVRLYHLERQSQGDMGDHWRMNLTLFNAWQHQARWGGHLSASPALVA